jgi:hypothetical protein
MDAGRARWLILWVACAASACERTPPSSESARPEVAAPAERRQARAERKQRKAAEAAAPAPAPAKVEDSAFARLQPRSLTSGDGQLAHDFGRVPAGQVVRHLFAFQWEGAAPLLPTSLRTDCGCLSARMYTRGADGGPLEHAMNQPLPPHAPFVIEIELDTRAMGGGSVRKSVTLFSEEPPGVLRMAVQGDVEL